MEHLLKTTPESYEAIKQGTKTFEIIQNDSEYNVGDIIILRELDPNICIDVKITYVQKLNDYTILGIVPGLKINGNTNYKCSNCKGNLD